ncbi:MAG: hypothetical protein HQ559_12895 [Lentisphaerae bacterium]|nr:hypothetical protein [Lentisphaerota bacterium]
MKKIVSIALLLVLLLALCPATIEARANRDPGGIMPFIVGCCLGLREGTEWNEGADVHWREWITLLILPAIWNGIECAGGITAHEWAEKNGANWY